MTRRIVTTIIGVVVATLLMVGAGTVVLANIRARSDTRQDLAADVAEISGNLKRELAVDPDLAARPAQAQVLQSLRSLTRFRKILTLDDLHILISTRQGQLNGDQLPTPLTLDILDPAALSAGDTVAGNVGNLVYAAQATELPRGQLLIVVLTRDANAGLGESIRLFLLSAIATLALGIAAAFIVGRRLSAPVREASDAAQRIAAGELDTRLPEPDRDRHDELADMSRSVNYMAATLQRNRLLDRQFLLSVSHDLRTPLTSIRGYAEAISDGTGDPKRSSAVILHESLRLERLVSDLLDLAKLEAREFTFHPQRMDLLAAAITAIDAFGPSAAERGIHLVQQHSRPTAVIADPDRLAQVIANLIENSLKFARQQVTVTVTADGEMASLWIDDDGPGIAEADLPYVFDRLYVASSTPRRKENSSGLGLAIVHDMMVAMGGTVRASRSTAGGARIMIGLPAVN